MTWIGGQTMFDEIAALKKENTKLREERDNLLELLELLKKLTKGADL